MQEVICVVKLVMVVVAVSVVGKRVSKSIIIWSEQINFLVIGGKGRWLIIILYPQNSISKLLDKTKTSGHAN